MLLFRLALIQQPKRAKTKTKTLCSDTTAANHVEACL